MQYRAVKCSALHWISLEYVSRAEQCFVFVKDSYMLRSGYLTKQCCAVQYSRVKVVDPITLMPAPPVTCPRVVKAALV